MAAQQAMSSNPNGFPRLGAEGRIDLITWQGRKVIRKSRIPKSYRNPDLDRLLRARRTREEIDILYLAKLACVNCPAVYFADPVSSEIIMEFINGRVLKDIESEGSRKSKGDNLELGFMYETLGAFASRLHTAKIIHGDLTTKNVIVTEKLEVYLVDFGLSFISERIEDKAEDMHLIRQALRSSTDSKRANSAFNLVMKSYAKESGVQNTRRILNQITEIEKRGRYARVD